MPRVPTYQPRVSPQSLPGVRFDAGGGSGGNPLGDAVVDVGLTLGRLAQVQAQRAEERQQELDTAAAQMAFGKAQERLSEWQARDLAGLRGLAAEGAPKAADEFLRTVYDDATRDLNPKARRRFDVFWPGARSGTVRQVWGHVEVETERARAEAAEAVVSAGVQAAVGTADSTAEAQALEPALAVLQDRHRAAGAAAEVFAESARRLLGKVATGKLSALQAKMDGATIPEQVPYLEGQLNDAIDARLRAGHIDASAAEQWKARAKIAGRTALDRLERSESERQRGNVYDWETQVWKAYDAKDGELAAMLAFAPDMADANPQYALHVRQVVQAIAGERKRAKAEQTAQERAEGALAEESALARLAVLEAQVKGGRLTPERAKEAMKAFRDDPALALTPTVWKAWNQTLTDVDTYRPSEPSHAGVWNEFEAAAKTGAFGDLVLERKTGKDLTEATVSRAQSVAARRKDTAKGDRERAEIARLEADRKRLYSEARTFTANWLRLKPGPVAASEYREALAAFLAGKMARLAWQESAAAAARLTDMAED